MSAAQLHVQLLHRSLVPAVVFVGAAAADPTKGFTAVSLSESNFVLQKPYDLPSDARYRFRGGVRQLWVLSSDKPHTNQSNTKPRTEIRMTVCTVTTASADRFCNIYLYITLFD